MYPSCEMNVKRPFQKINTLFEGKRIVLTGFSDKKVENYINRSGGCIVYGIASAQILIYDPDNIDQRSKTFIAYAKRSDIACWDRFDFQTDADRSYEEIMADQEDKVPNLTPIEKRDSPDQSKPMSLRGLYLNRRQRHYPTKSTEGDESASTQSASTQSVRDRSVSNQSVCDQSNCDQSARSLCAQSAPEDGSDSESDSKRPVKIRRTPIPLNRMSEVIASPPKSLSISDENIDELLRDLEDLQRAEVVIPFGYQTDDRDYYRDDTIGDDTIDNDIYDGIELIGSDWSEGAFDSDSDFGRDIISESGSESGSESESETDYISEKERRDNRHMCQYINNNHNYFFDGIGFSSRTIKNYDWNIRKVLRESPEILFFVKSYLPGEDEDRFNQVFEKYTNAIMDVFDSSKNGVLRNYLENRSFAEDIYNEETKGIPLMLRTMNSPELKYHDPGYIYGLYKKLLDGEEGKGKRKRALKKFDKIIAKNIKEVKKKRIIFRRTFLQILDDYYYENLLDTTDPDFQIYSLAFMNGVLLLILGFIEELLDLHVIGVNAFILDLLSMYLPLDAIICCQFGKKKNIPVQII